MSDLAFSVGTVGAASIAATVSMIGLVVAKENKTSEFRQEWINALRESISDAVSAVAALNIYGEMPLTKENAPDISEAWRKVSKSLSLVELRLNPLEDDHLELQAMIRRSEVLVKEAVGGKDVADQLEKL